MMNEFPELLYRADGVKIESKLVNNAEEAAIARSQGWGDRATAKLAAAMPARTGMIVGAAVAQAAKPDTAELNKTKEALAASQEAAESAREYAVALGARVDTLEGFLRGLAADEGAPEQLRADITALLGEGGEDKPAKKKAAKK
jgi:hypothetical protein